MATSRVPATIDALVALFTDAGLTTWDGPFVTGEHNDAVYVGYDGDPEGDFQAVEADQEWAGLGAHSRDEEFEVICCATVASGEKTIKPARERAYAVLAVVEAALRANPSLGMSPPFVAAFKPAGLYVEPVSSAGFQVRALFNVHVKTRI